MIDSDIQMLKDLKEDLEQEKSDIEERIAIIEKEIKQKLKDEELRPSIILDCEISLADIDWNLWDYLEKFEPYGMDNHKPKFLIKDCLIRDIGFMGKDESHLRLLVEQLGITKKVVGFSMSKNFVDIKINDKIDMVIELDVNEWNGNRGLEVYLLDFKKV